MEYWYVWQVGKKEEAESLYQWYEGRKIPVLLFRNTFMDDWLVASYTDDETHGIAKQETEIGSIVDGYVGEERVFECFIYHPLLKSNTKEVNL